MPEPKKHPGGRPVKYETPDDMQVKIDAYFSACDSRVKQIVTKEGVVTVRFPAPYTIQGLAVALNLTMEGLSEFQAKPEFSVTVKTAKQRCEANKVQHMLDGDGYGPGYIFDLKNNHGWKDQQQIEHSGSVHVHFDQEDKSLL